MARELVGIIFGPPPPPKKKKGGGKNDFGKKWKKSFSEKLRKLVRNNFKFFYPSFGLKWFSEFLTPPKKNMFW